MRLFVTFVVSVALVALLALFVWGWYVGDKVIPEVVFGGLLGLIGTVVGYMWLKDRQRQ